jgi:hypothetical protein
VLRAAAADVPPTGGRTGKLLLFAAGLAAIVALARRRVSDVDQSLPAGDTAGRRAARLTIAGGLVVLTIAALLPATSPWIREKLTFVAYAAFHLFSPVVQPPAPAWFVDPQTRVYWLAGLAVCGVAAVVVVAAWPMLRRLPALVFVAAVVLAAILPVSTMTGGTRYLYFASAGTSLGLALLAQTLTSRWRTIVQITIVTMLVLAPMQIVIAGRAWIWASEMSADAASLLAPRLAPCGTVELVLLTAPVQIRGVYSNLNAETFSTRGCAPASMRTLTRVLRDDVVVEITSAGGAIEWRVPADNGNIVASRDLRTFDVPLRSPERLALATPLGTLETWREGPGRRFRIEAAETASRRVFAYYGSGRVRLLPGTVQ